MAAGFGQQMLTLLNVVDRSVCWTSPDAVKIGLDLIRCAATATWRQGKKAGRTMWRTRVHVAALETAWMMPNRSSFPRLHNDWRCKRKERRSRPCSAPAPFQCSAACHRELLGDAATGRMGLKSTISPLPVALHSLPSGSSQHVAVCGFQPASRRVVMTAAKRPPTRHHLLADCVRYAGGEHSTRVLLLDAALGARSTMSATS